MRRTKIVCTLGPASGTPETLRDMIKSGMDVARVNFSHGDHLTHSEFIALVKRIGSDERRPVAILADLQGPKLRVGELPVEGLALREGARVVLTTQAQSAGNALPIPHFELLRELNPGQTLLFDDGALELVVEETQGDAVICRILTGGTLFSRKGISVPGSSLALPSLTEKDREDVRFALDLGVDFLALSFVRQPDDVAELHDLVTSRGTDCAIIAKIEKPEALVSFEEILNVSDGIMVARGDLGVETPAEEVPFHQKRIISACNKTGKPVITATQMLQSMMTNLRPTRAEASDVANAILDGTDAVMLSGETAVGRYPVESVRTMARICGNAEQHLPHHRLVRAQISDKRDAPLAITRAAVEIAHDVDARFIVTGTMSGLTARLVARHRPTSDIIAVTPRRQTFQELLLVWGVQPRLIDRFERFDQMVDVIEESARAAGGKTGDVAVFTAGVPFGGDRKTNMVKIHVLGR